MTFDFTYLITQTYWLTVRDNILRWKFVGTFIGLYGIIWGVLEPVTFFFSNPDDTAKIRRYWWLFLLCALIVAILKSFPKFKYKYLINGKDVIIELSIGDFFRKKGDMIISANSHFITDLNNEIISSKSIQGQFTKRYYTNVSHLDNDLDNALSNEIPINTQNTQFGKSKEYKLGTTAKIIVKKRNRGQTAYFVAISKMNHYGVCNCSIEEFGEALGVLWNYLKERGFKEDIIMPIMGSGYARVDAKREDLIRIIAKSFVAATADKKFCDKLSIVAYPKDINKFDLNLERVRTYLHYEINY